MTTKLELPNYLIRRFWSKVKKRGEDECWLWKEGKTPEGYGLYRAGAIIVRANRLALALHLELDYFDQSWHALHKCDNPPCCNPHHLFPGSNSENVQDKVDKARQHRGADIATSKLTEDAIRDIRSSVHSASVMATKYGISERNVRLIRSYVTWRHVK